MIASAEAAGAPLPRLPGAYCSRWGDRARIHAEAGFRWNRGLNNGQGRFATPLGRTFPYARSVAEHDRIEELFLVRFWREQGAAWRGYVEHVATKRRVYFSELSDLNEFLRLRLADATRAGAQ